MFTLFVLSALVVSCLADDPYNSPGYKQNNYKEPEHYEEAKYAYDWNVKDDQYYNDFGQYEKREGYNTDGNYHVLLPDGRVQTVKYYVNGDSGYVAEVTYSGEAKYDNYKPAASYKTDTYAPAPYKADPYKPAPYAPAPYKADPYKPAPYAPVPYKADPYKSAPAYKADPYKQDAYHAPSYKQAPAY